MKTRQQALNRTDGGQIPLGSIARDVWRCEGVRGFYRGFGTVILGSFPARILFVPILEYSKTRATQMAEGLGFRHVALPRRSVSPFPKHKQMPLAIPIAKHSSHEHGNETNILYSLPLSPSLPAVQSPPPRWARGSAAAWPRWSPRASSCPWMSFPSGSWCRGGRWGATPRGRAGGPSTRRSISYSVLCSLPHALCCTIPRR